MGMPSAGVKTVSGRSAGAEVSRCSLSDAAEAASGGWSRMALRGDEERSGERASGQARLWVQWRVRLARNALVLRPP
eukprot:scaffold280676_cov27-Tisochrysis_lutea.AAC.2